MSDGRRGSWLKIRHPAGVKVTRAEVDQWVHHIECLVVANPPLAKAVAAAFLDRYRVNRHQKYEAERQLRELRELQEDQP